MSTGKRKVGRIVNFRQQKERSNLKEKNMFDLRALIRRPTSKLRTRHRR